MKLSAQFTFWASLVFAIACLAYGAFGFSSIDASMSDAARDDSRGYAWFWTILGGIGGISAIVSWLVIQGRLGTSGE